MKPAAELVDLDWNPSNLIGLQRALRLAYNETDAACDSHRHPFFATRNRAYGLGYNRWLAVDYYLKQACELGWIKGITSTWVPLGGIGGLCVMEMRGAYTSVLAVHLQEASETPRDSDYRYDKRLMNEKNPMLQGFEDPEDASQLLNLLLVHGDKTPDFAELRAYDDPKKKGSFTPFTANIMAGAAIVSPADSEAVPEPNVALIPGTHDQRKPSTGA